jgi:hypothetical protein
MKTCKQCDFPVFSHGYCKHHQFLRKDEKYLNSLSKKKKVYNIPSKNKDKKERVDFGFKTQVQMFDHLYDSQIKENGHLTCWLSGEPILNIEKGSSLYYSMFAHVLRKGKYTYWKLNPENIRIIQPLLHGIVDNWVDEYTTTYPNIDFNKWFSLQDEMQERYREFKTKMLLA